MTCFLVYIIISKSFSYIVHYIKLQKNKKNTFIWEKLSFLLILMHDFLPAQALALDNLQIV